MLNKSSASKKTTHVVLHSFNPAFLAPPGLLALTSIVVIEAFFSENSINSLLISVGVESNTRINFVEPESAFIDSMRFLLFLWFGPIGIMQERFICSISFGYQLSSPENSIGG